MKDYNIKNGKTTINLQHGMPDPTITSGDKRVVFSPSSERAAGNKIN